MIRFKTKLLLAITSLILIVLLIEGLVLGKLFKNYYENTFNDRIERESVFMSNYIKENGGIDSFVKQGKTDVVRLLDANFTIIGTDGKVYYDSNKNQTNHPARHQAILQSIAETYDGLESKGYRMIEGENDLHYYWNTIIKDGQVEGFTALSNDIGVIEQVNQKMWWVLFISFAISMMIIIAVLSRLAEKYIKPIEAATHTAIELTEGNYRARTYEKGSDNIDSLSKALNTLARNLQEMKISKDMHEDRLETLIENIGSGVLQIDHKGQITLLNRVYKELFHVDDADLLNRVYYEVIKHKEIIRIIEEIFITENSIKQQVLIPLSIERKHFEVYGAPIIVKNDEWRGIILVFHDITELKKLEQMRKDFVANVSHELKTPITSIKGFSETLLDGALKDEKALHEFLKIILTESDRLQGLIQELLDLSKIEQQEYILQVNKIEIGSVLEETVVMLKGKAEEKKISLILTLDNKPLWIEGESYRVKQIFINLITNALNYTPIGGEIKVNAKDLDNSVEIEVCDSGIGIESEEIPRIFERFYRVDKARSRDSGGTGLGLAIVKHIIEVHQGKIAVQSSPGTGTTFTVTLQKQVNDKTSQG